MPPGEGRLHFIGIVVHEAEALTGGCHEGLEGHEEATRCRRRCWSWMMLREDLRGRRLGRAWDLMIGPGIPGALILEVLGGEERLPRTSRRATLGFRFFRGCRRPLEGQLRGTSRVPRGLHVFETLRV